MAAIATSEEAGFVRKGNYWICKLSSEDGTICDQSFLRSKKEPFREHRVNVHSEEGPLPALKPGRVSTKTKAEHDADHAARQARYAARNGSEVMKEQRDACKLKKQLEIHRNSFKKQFPFQSDISKPQLRLPGIMTFLSNGISHTPGELDESSFCAHTMWELARHKLCLVSLSQLCTKANHPNHIAQSALRAYVEHAGLDFGQDSLSWYEAAVWNPMMKKIV
ncbi:hypothetical protein KFL_015890010, partial [Klebsormidium nitens]